MPIILKMTPLGKRAHIVPQDDLDAMLDNGTAVQCEGYEFFEEVTPEESAQGYLTRNMEAIKPAKRRGRPPKVQQDDQPTAE